MEDRTILIFGGNGGIGTAIRLAAAKQGFNVVVADLIVPKKDQGFDFISADLTKEADVKRAILYALEKYQTVDVVVNCQGTYKIDSIENTTSESLEEMLDVNLKTVFLVCKNIVPVMKWRRGGYIINIASMSGLRGKKGQAAYCASKFAVVGLTEALYEELRGTGVRVSAVCPTSVNTKMLSKQIKMTEAEEKKILQAEDVALVVMELANSNPRVYRKIVPIEIEIDIDKLDKKK